MSFFYYINSFKQLMIYSRLYHTIYMYSMDNLYDSNILVGIRYKPKDIKLWVRPWKLAMYRFMSKMTKENPEYKLMRIIDSNLTVLIKNVFTVGPGKVTSNLKKLNILFWNSHINGSIDLGIKLNRLLIWCSWCITLSWYY